MDPEATYTEFLCALTEHRYEEAREYARALLSWIESGGFVPARCLRDEKSGEPRSLERFASWLGAWAS